MTRARIHDSGADISVCNAGAQQFAGDAPPASIASPWVRRSRFRSGTAAVMPTATLAEGRTLTLSGLAVETASDDEGGGLREHAAHGGSLVLTGGVGGTTELGLLRLNIELSGAAEYVRLKLAPAFSAGATGADTCIAQLTFVFGGYDGASPAPAEVVVAP